MDFNFHPSVPCDFNKQPVLISGKESLQFSNNEYLVVNDEVFEVRFRYFVSPFKEVIITENLIAVGFQDNFYLYDKIDKTTLLVFPLNGYFGGLRFHEQRFYICDMESLYCIDKSGELLWQSNSLAVDGLVIKDFTAHRITVQAELDPPGGWKDFILNKETGEIIKT
ncbi:hypothetical protein V1389_09060 [Flavobacterium rakeshii]|uniref:hypothetical protein n=1 Tax=Flavobacterium rakeshii TaxID=1038845 RepID=UPI002E7C154E|nr:hypothetical protein [Flavobacterium rakeshii]MEE1898483.1 hypothetical protein [Flavobacterium rakeshii]